MKKAYFLFWQTFSLQIAYSIANIYLNINNYIAQLEGVFNTTFYINFHENPIIALVLFLVTFAFPNLYVHISLHAMKDDLMNKKIQRDINIKPHEYNIEINGKEYSIRDNLDKRILNFTLLISIFPFIIDYKSLVLLPLYFFTLAIISIVHTEGSLFLMNPYLLLKFNIFTLQNNGKTLYIIIEKEKEFENPRFSDYVIDWYYDHLILIGFKKNLVSSLP
jgi:hypothetical protein